MSYLLRVEFFAVKVEIVCMSPFLMLESFSIASSALCLFGVSSHFEYMVLFDCYPTDLAVYCDYLSSW